MFTVELSLPIELLDRLDKTRWAVDFLTGASLISVK